MSRSAIYCRHCHSVIGHRHNDKDVKSAEGVRVIIRVDSSLIMICGECGKSRVFVEVRP